MMKLLGVLFFGLLSLASAVVTAFCFWVGAQNNWTSDGPAMLMVYLGIALFGGGTFAFGWVGFSIVTGEGARS